MSVDETAPSETGRTPPRSLHEVPLLVEAAVHPVDAPSPVTRRALQSYGAFRRDELRAATLELPRAELDWTQVVALRRRVSEEIAGESEHQLRNTGTPLGGDDRLLLGRAVIRRVVADHVRTLHREGAALWTPAEERSYVEAVEDAVFGYGRLQPLLALPDVENIEIHGWDSVVVQFGDGRREAMPPVADNDAELVEAIRFLGQNAEPSRPFDDVHPTMTLALGERFRLHAIGFGLSYRPSVVIRQHTMTAVSLVELAEGGLMPLEAMDRWVRTLAATLSTGRSVTDAIRVSRRTAPPAIAEEVEVLVLRLNNRWDTGAALQRFADALDSPDTDAVVAALMLAAGRGAAGAATTLNALAESIQAQLRARRVIEVERSKPYVVVRQVTVITLVTLGGMFLLRPEFFAGYRTPIGQAVLAVLVSIYLGSLLLMRRKARQPERPRILVGNAP